MLVAQLLPILLSLIVTRPRPLLSTSYQEGSDLLLSHDISLSDEILFSVSHLFRHQKKLSPSPPHVIQLLLLLSGTVEVNPGPYKRPPKFPCGECNQAVTKSSNSIACDQCQKWHHTNCIGMNDILHNCYVKDDRLNWTCIKCAVPNINMSLFDSSLDSDESVLSDTNTPEQLKARNLRLMIINFQSLWAKKELFHKSLSETNADIVIGTETHLDPSIKESEFLPKGYTSFRNDRADNWGGVIIIVKETLIAEEIFKSKQTECIAIKIETMRKPVIVCCAYRPPKSPKKYAELLSNDINFIMNIKKYKASPFWIGGDWNLPDINWETNSITGHQYPKPINETFIDMMNVCNLEQIVDFPTRNNNILDILFTNNTTLITSSKDIPGISDHTAIAIVDILCHPFRNQPIPRVIYLWNRAEIPLMKRVLHEDIISFCNKFKNCDKSTTNELWSEFKNITNKTMKNVPTKTTSTRFNQPWINQRCKKFSRRKKRLYKRAKRTRLQSDWEKFNSMSAKCKKNCREAHDKFINENILDSGNSKKFYSYIKSKQQDNISVAPLKKGDKLIIDDKQKANILNDQYCSVFSNPCEESPPINSTETKTILKNIVIAEKGVLLLLNNLKTNKATGPDSITSRFLKEFSTEIAPALTLIFNTSFNTGSLPDDWLHAHIVPVYKGGNKNRNLAENYRPISLTSICWNISYTAIL